MYVPYFSPHFSLFFSFFPKRQHKRLKFKTILGQPDGTFSHLFSVELCIFAMLVLVPLCIAGYNRNSIWKDEITLWTDVVKNGTEKDRGFLALGNLYQNEG